MRLDLLPLIYRFSSMHTRMALLFILLSLLFNSSCADRTTDEPTVAPVAPTALQLVAPVEIVAGEPLSLTVIVTPLEVTDPILLTAQGTFGFYPQRLVPEEGRANFLIPALHTRHAGTVTVRASVGKRMALAEVTIQPGAVVDPILPLVGPRSIVVGGEHWTMAVTTPRDMLGNPAAEGTRLILHAQHPVAPGNDASNGLELLETRTQNLLSWARIYSRSQAGRLLISATAGAGHSPERVVLEVPGSPRPFTIYANPAVAPADGHQWINLRSDQIVDTYGNVLLDGTEATVIAAMPPHEARSQPVTTIDGRLYTTIQAPTEPGTMFLRAWIGDVASEMAQITFTAGPAVQQIPISYTVTADALTLRAGPLIGARGQFVPDGTDVELRIYGPLSDRLSMAADELFDEVRLPAEYGYASLIVRTLTLQPGTYLVRVTAGTGMGETAVVIRAEGEIEVGGATSDNSGAPSR